MSNHASRMFPSPSATSSLWLTARHLSAGAWRVRYASGGLDSRGLLVTLQTAAHVPIKISSGASVHSIALPRSIAGVGTSRLIVKVRTLGAADRIKALCGGGRAKRAREGAAWLHRHGLSTALPLLHATTGAFELQVMPELAGRSLLFVLADEFRAPSETGRDTESAIAAAVGRDLATMVLAGRFNRDHKPSNLIVYADGAEVNVAIIDTVAILPVKPRAAMVERAARMLSSLLIEPMGCGIAPRRALRWRVLLAFLEAMWIGQAAEGDTTPLDVDWQQQSARAIWGMVAKLIARHGPMVPVDDPLESYELPAPESRS